MWRYRLKVTLLALGVVLGYGSALHHHARHHARWLGQGGTHECGGWGWHDERPAPNAASQNPSKPVH